MEVIAQLGSLLGISFISGINLYATVAVVGLCVKHGLVQGLPPELNVLAHDGVIFVAVCLYMIEFFMDKIPGLDTLWDTVHTLIRPLGGAMLALMQVGEASPAMEVIVFLLGASLAAAAHVTKAGTRLLVQASPEPFSNVLLSLTEDVAAVGYAYLSLAHPTWTFFVTLVCLAVILVVLPFLFRTIRMLLGALFFRIRALVVPVEPAAASDGLPFHWDQFFENVKHPGEQVIWTAKAYAAKIPSVPRAAGIQLVVTTANLYALYRRRFRFQARKLERSAIQQQRTYPGRVLARCLIRTPGETWLVQMYQPLAQTLPQEPLARDAQRHVPT